MRKHKPYQLAMAQKVGVKIPLTLMTNDVEQARAFWRRHEGEVIYKQFIAFPDAWRETRRLRPENETQPEVVPAPADTPGWRFSGTFPPAAATRRSRCDTARLPRAFLLRTRAEHF